jgi:hypothetical protein
MVDCELHAENKVAIVHCRLNAYWLGWSPSTFYRVYTIEASQCPFGGCSVWSDVLLCMRMTGHSTMHAELSHVIVYMQAFVLIGVRWVVYKLKRWHYYLLGDRIPTECIVSVPNMILLEHARDSCVHMTQGTK